MVQYIGKKIGMTRGFTESGEAFPISVIALENNEVVSTKSTDEEVKVTIGAIPVKDRKNKKFKVVKEFSSTKEEIGEVKEGQTLSIDIINNYKFVTVEGTSKGKGFSGVIKRHGFARGPETHGSDHHRHPGSIGCMFPQRVIAGKKMPGHMGAGKSTAKNLSIVGVDKDRNALLVKGSIPGPVKGNLIISLFNK